MGIKRLSRPRTELSQEHKVAFVLLAFLGLGGLILGFRSFGANLNRPIHEQIVENFTGEQYLSPEQKLSKEKEKQRKQDTDLDGLNDYDELYVYRSSPYLKDTDSDAIDDRTEVFAGQDPNCATGKTCGALAASEETADDTPADVEGILSVFSDPEGALKAGVTGELDSKEEIETFFNALTMNQLRQALLRSGMPKAQLDQITDEQLQQYFSGALSDLNQETTSEAEASVEASEGTDGNTTQE